MELTAQKERIKSEKKKRDLDRQNVVHATEKEKNDFELQLSEASKKESIILKKMTKYWRLTLETAKLQVGKFESEITQRKETRRLLSASLQQQLFANYTFLNSFGVPKSLGSIFNENPPAGAGECAAPKLLQYAYSHKLNPICMAEFWWGASPKSEVRKHKQFYPACTGKCEPILGHMLEGIETDTNPFKINTAEGKDIAIVYEDDLNRIFTNTVLIEDSIVQKRNLKKVKKDLIAVPAVSKINSDDNSIIQLTSINDNKQKDTLKASTKVYKILVKKTGKPDEEITIIIE